MKVNVIDIENGQVKEATIETDVVMNARETWKADENVDRKREEIGKKTEVMTEDLIEGTEETKTIHEIVEILHLIDIDEALHVADDAQMISDVLHHRKLPNVTILDEMMTESSEKHVATNAKMIDQKAQEIILKLLIRAQIHRQTLTARLENRHQGVRPTKNRQKKITKKSATLKRNQRKIKNNDHVQDLAEDVESVRSCFDENV